MPCYDSRGHISGGELDKKIKDIQELKDRNAILSAMLCAILNELEARGITEEIAVNASRHGLIDIAGFWAAHKQEDKARLNADFHKRYSVDEQLIIKQLLEQQK